MRVSPVDNRLKQLEMFPHHRRSRPLNGHGRVRLLTGEFFELLSEERLGMSRHMCVSKYDYCPDLSRGTRYFECKAMGLSGSTLIYSGRLEKDQVFAEKHSLSYLIWHHTCQSEQCETESDLFCELRNSVQWAAIVPLESIVALCRETGETPLNSNYGGCRTRKIYGSGYRIPKRKLKPWILPDERIV